MQGRLATILGVKIFTGEGRAMEEALEGRSSRRSRWTSAGALVRLALTLAVLLAPRGAAAGPGQLVASGCSVSNLGYLADLAAEYERRSGVRMYVRGGGSVIGLDDLISGKVDFAAACRGRKAADPAGIEFVQVAWDALVFIVHPANPVGGITLAEAREIYEGKLTDWGGLAGGAPGPITVFLQRPVAGLSGVESSVRGLVLGGAVPTPGPGSVELASSGLVEQLVEKTPAGFGATGFTSARRRQVRMLPLAGVAPTRDSIARRAYPLVRPLYLVLRAPVAPEVRAFVDFALGAEGQRFIGSLGAVALRDVP